MAEPFLKQIAEHFYKLTSLPGATPLHQYRFIFHNQRAGIFLCHYLEQCSGETPILLPECTTMNNLLRQRFHMIGDEDPNSELLIIHKIYLAYLQVMGLTYTERTFEDFYDFGKSLLRDFDDIDKHLIEVDSFLENLLNYKEITQDLPLSERQWEAICKLIQGKEIATPVSDPKSSAIAEEMKRQFLDFWMKLPDLYRAARELLRDEGLAYEGMMLRDAAEGIESGELTLTDDGIITVFAGLNAQTPAMYRILDHFRDSGQAIFYWDYFTEPILQSPHLAGSFVEKNKKDYPSPSSGDYFIDFEVPDQQRELRTALISTPSAVAQGGAIKNLLERSSTDSWNNIKRSLCNSEGEAGVTAALLYDPEAPIRTAIVLPDENLLLPILSNLPEDLPEVNVTMGYPIKGTPVAAMLSLLLKHWTNYYRRKQTYRLTEVSDILMLTALNRFFVNEKMGEARQELLHHMSEMKLFFLSGDALREQLIPKFFPKGSTRAILLAIFVEHKLDPATTDDVPYPTGSALTEQVLQILDLLISDYAPEDEERTQLSVIKYIRRELILPQLTSQRTYCKRHPESATNPFTYPVVTDLLRTTIARARVPFSGMPLRGLQVMGILETRGLDFDTVIIPDAAEGILPTATQLDTTIPFSLRRGYKLPTTDLQEQTRAYNFFRLMSRAKRVVFLYDSRPGDASVGEPSRYVQLLRDVYHIPMYEAEASFPLISAEGDDLSTFHEDQELVSQYRAKISANEPTEEAKYLSASQMRNFHTCPRRFYYTAIEGIKDDENLSGLMDKRDAGNIFHEAMKRIYKPYESKPTVLTETELNSILSSDAITCAVNASAEKLHLHYETNDYNHTQIQMAAELARRMVEADLERVRADGPITYVGGEIVIQTSYEGANFKLIVDRIDMQGDTVNIIDYKTGRDSTECDLSTWPTESANLGECLKQAKQITGGALQLLYYCDVLTQTGLLTTAGKVRPMIFKPNAADVTSGVITLKLPEKQGRSYIRREIKDYKSDGVPDYVKDCLREAVRLILNDDFSFEVEAGNKDGCSYCPAALLCDKYIPNNF